MRERPYQLDCKAAVLREFERTDSTLVSMATGLGKTIIFAHLAAEWQNGRVLILAQKRELVRQTALKIQAVTGEMPAIEMGDQESDECEMLRSKIVVGSVQTLASARRRGKFDASTFGLVVVDECHHAVSPGHMAVLLHFRRAKLLGLTATPKRHDQLALRPAFETVAYEYPLREAIDDGWLVPVVQKIVVVKGLDFSRVRKVCGKMNESDLEQIVTTDAIIHQVAAPAIKEIGQRSALVYCVTKKHARVMATVLNAYRDGCAVALTDDSTEGEVSSALQRFRSGELPLLCSCGMFNEGFDAQICSAVVMARPTESTALYQQMLGRGTRTWKTDVDGCDDATRRRQEIAFGPKKDLRAYDFVGNAGKHKIVSCDDILGGRYPDEVHERHKKRPPDEDDAETLDEALARQALELALEEEQAELRKQITAEVEYETVEESPFDGPAVPRREQTYKEAPSVKQMARLIGWGYDRQYVEGLTKRHAGYLIGKGKAEMEARRGS